MSLAGAEQAGSVDPTVLRRGVRLNAVILAIVFGLCCGLTFMTATYAALAFGAGDAGGYLGLFEVFMPGYSVTAVGALVGFFWTFVYAALSGGFVYLIYARTIGVDIVRNITFDAGQPPTLFRLTLRLSGKALGLAVGAMLAAQLFLSTAWLVVRGTADESRHAALLSNYLPGYSVSFWGGAIGALWLFLYAAGVSFVFAYVYNSVVSLRKRGRAARKRRAG